jgi:hypothetical protein
LTTTAELVDAGWELSDYSSSGASVWHDRGWVRKRADTGAAVVCVAKIERGAMSIAGARMG